LFLGKSYDCFSDNFLVPGIFNDGFHLNLPLFKEVNLKNLQFFAELGGSYFNEFFLRFSIELAYFGRDGILERRK
jgi:hypothetical protein